MSEIKTVYIQLANKCNNNCTTCIFYNDPEYSSEHEFMEQEVIDKLIDEITITSSIKEVFYGPLYGEAQLHPYFYEMVSRIKLNRPDIKIGLLTNGKLITDEALRLYKGDDIYISILGNKTNGDTYEQVTGLKWGRLGDAVSRVKNSGVSYAFYINMATFADVEEAIDSLEGLGDFRAIYTVKEYRNLLQKPGTTTAISNYINAKYESLHNKYKVIVERGGCDYVPKAIGTSACKIMLENNLTVMSSGDVLVCPCDTSLKSVYGNIMKDSLCNLFNSKYMNNVRAMVKVGIFPKRPCLRNCFVNGTITPGIPIHL